MKRLFFNNLLLWIACRLTQSLKEFRYLRALPCAGRYSPGGLHTEYLRSLRIKKKIEVEDGYVKTDRDELTSF